MKTMLLTLDDLDYDAIQKEIANYQATHRWDDADGGVMLPEGESCLAGAIIAESMRILDEYRSMWEAKHPPKQ